MTSLAIGVVIGVAAGVLAGLFGIGGGILIVPTLVFLGLTQREATGTSLAALLMPVGILGVLEYARRHEVRPGYAAGIALGLLLGIALGARVAGQLSNVTLQRLFGLLLAATAARFLLFPR
jgi:uncharacterized membrane protein YfcA